MIVECTCGWSGYDSELYENKCPKCDGNVMAAAPEDQARPRRIEAGDVIYTGPWRGTNETT